MNNMALINEIEKTIKEYKRYGCKGHGKLILRKLIQVNGNYEYLIGKTPSGLGVAIIPGSEERCTGDLTDEVWAKIEREALAANVRFPINVFGLEKVTTKACKVRFVSINLKWWRGEVWF